MRLLAACLLLACGGLGYGQAVAPSPKAKGAQIMTVLLRNPWTAIDQSSSYDIGTYFIVANLYETLVAFDGSADRFKPWLSTAVPTRENGLLSADGRTYRFPIRKGVKFHDGTRLTPEDVRYSFLRELVIQRNSKPPSFMLGPLFKMGSNVDSGGLWALTPEQMEKAVRVEGDAVVFELQAPFPGFLRLVGTLPVVTSKAWHLKNGGWNGVPPAKGAPQPTETSPFLMDHANGTGAFMVESGAPGTKLVLKRHPDYWGPAPALEGVVFRSEPSDPMRASALVSGDADYVYLERPILPLVEDAGGVSVIDDIPGYSSGEAFFFTFDVDSKDNPRLGSGKFDGKGIPPDFFTDKDARLGFAHAFSAGVYARMALNGKGTPAYGPIPPSMIKEGSLKDAAPAYDLKKAEAAFRRAHGGKLWDSGFTLTLSYMRGNVRRQVAAEVLKSGVESLNAKFKVQLEAVAPADYPGHYQSHRLPIWVQELVGDFPDPHSLAFSFFHSKGFFARAQRFSRPDFDALEEKAAQETDPAKREQLFLDLEAKALAEAVQIYSYHPVQFKAVRSWLKGLEKNQGVNGLSFANLLYLAPIQK
ncbi:MAG: hypothetical protein HY078_05205 [Elusimicrobia bacterium]|nr:hypothetical protein [Elusimicrobiota bacterium]